MSPLWPPPLDRGVRRWSVLSGLERGDVEEEEEEEGVEVWGALSAATETCRRRSGNRHMVHWYSRKEVHQHGNTQGAAVSLLTSLTWKRPSWKAGAGLEEEAGVAEGAPPDTVSGLRALLSWASRLPMGCCGWKGKVSVTLHFLQHTKVLWRVGGGSPVLVQGMEVKSL